MQIVLTDETNTTVGKSTFFLVGAISVPADVASHLHLAVEGIRHKYGYQPDDSFKYARADKPAHIDNEAFNEAKSEALDLFAAYDIKIILYACHHLIAENRSAEEKFKWGCNALLWVVQCFLNEIGHHALVLQDRHPVGNEFSYYKERFRQSDKYSPENHKLRNMVGFGSTCDEASHLSALCDIALGSYRFCLNHQDKDIVNGILMPKLLAATWGFPEPIDKGFSLFPRRKIYKRECVADYQRIREHVAKFCA